MYEQAKWAILLEEFDTTEQEAFNFAALQVGNGSVDLEWSFLVTEMLSVLYSFKLS